MTDDEADTAFFAVGQWINFFPDALGWYCFTCDTSSDGNWIPTSLELESMLQGSRVQ